MIARLHEFALAWCSVLLIAGCAPGMIRATAVEGTMTRVIERHQAYTKNNKDLSPLQRRTDLRDGQLLKQVLDEALEKETDQ